MSTQNLTQNPQARNGHTPAKAFTQAFCPPAKANNQIRTELLARWSLSVSEVIHALIDFRSALHRWATIGPITDTAFMAEVQLLAEAGLLEWLDANPLGLDDLREVVTGVEQ